MSKVPKENLSKAQAILKRFDNELSSNLETTKGIIQKTVDRRKIAGLTKTLKSLLKSNKKRNSEILSILKLIAKKRNS